MKNFRKMCRGEKGFTLIELLVVIIILGILAAVVTLAVTRFIGKGTLESANAEAVTLQAAIESALAEGNSATLVNANLVDWAGAEATSPYTAGSDNVTVASMMRTHQLKAMYTLDIDGNIIDADPVIVAPATGTGWGATIHWDTNEAKWHRGAA